MAMFANFIILTIRQGVDRKGLICEQRGVFRVNCVDCLDRTNVVQTAIARIVMETQCRKLGLLAPDETLPENCRKIFQQAWANTGDAISKQYAGTAALKGDFTRTGERKISGMMKDGMNSANRYYLRFKDTYRQAAIDLTHGQPVSEDILSGRLRVPEDDVRELLEKEENVKQLIEDCSKMLVVEPETCLGGWALINAEPGMFDSERQEMDTILLLSQRAVYVAWYDEEEEQVNEYQRIFLEDIEKLELGAEHFLLRSKCIVMRLHYRHYADEGFFHTFKAPGTRLFNNLVIPVKTQEEAKEQLKVVCEAFVAAQNLLKLELTVEEKTKLDKKKTSPHPEVKDIHQELQENSLSKIKLPRDVSSSDIPTQSSSASSSPRLRHRLSPNPRRRKPVTNKVSQAGAQLGLKADRMKSWISNMPKLNKPNPGSVELPTINLKSLNIANKLKVSKADASRLLSKVPGTSIFYKRKQDGSQDESDVFIDQEFTDKPTALKSQISRERTYSKDDSSVDGSFDISDADLEGSEVVLGSCGILATNAKQILESPRCSFDEEEMDYDDNATNDDKSNLADDKEKYDSVEDIATDENGKLDDVDSGKKLSDMDEELTRNPSFKCFCSTSEPCPHTSSETEDIWVRRTESLERVAVPTKLNLQKRVVAENSEADLILAKYSAAKSALTHPNMRNSMSDSAIAGNQVSIALENFSDESPKSALELDFELNEELQKKLPNLLQSSKMPRKCHKIYEGLKQHIEEELGDKTCFSTIILL
ncbi:Phosphatidylinositide phosphatase SAC2 [Mactra antiquata]